MPVHLRVDCGCGLVGYGLLVGGLILLAADGSALRAQDAPVPQTAQSVTGAPIAIVPVDTRNPDAAATVTGALEVADGKAMIGASGTIASGTRTTEVTLPHRGVLRVCAATTVKLASDAGAPSGVVPGLLMAMDHGAIEASFATGRDSDILLTPDFRILIGGPGEADVKVRLGAGGDTCVDNAGVNAPYVLVTSVFDGGAYRVQAGQRVMFEHGNLHEVVDAEKEPCGCPPDANTPNEFPLAASEGLALTPPPVSSAAKVGHEAESTGTLAYNANDHAPKPAEATSDSAQSAAPANVPPAVTPAKKKPGFFGRVRQFFRKIFGAE